MNEAFEKHCNAKFKDGVYPKTRELYGGLFEAGQEATELRVSKALGGLPESELWGDDGLIAATMRTVDAYEASLEEPPKQ